MQKAIDYERDTSRHHRECDPQYFEIACKRIAHAHEKAGKPAERVAVTGVPAPANERELYT